MYIHIYLLQKRGLEGHSPEWRLTPRLRRRSLPGEGVRLQFVNVKTGRVQFSSVFKRELLTIVEGAAEKDGISVSQFIINAMEWALPRLELKASQGQGRAAA